MIKVLACLLAITVSSTALAQHAADAFYDPNDMAKARAALKAGHGAQINSLLLMERLELHSVQNEPSLVWDSQAWVGGDAHKLWLKAEGHYDVEEGNSEELEFQALYSRAISPFWDVQLGVRHDTRPGPSRSYTSIGLHGLAPYWFEVDSSLFVSDQGDASVRIEAEYEFRLTQRLLLQPRIELNAAFSDDEELGIGSGLTTTEAGLRLRYEIIREFAPYIGVSVGRAFGRTADLMDAEGDDTDEVNFVVGLRFWF